MVDRRGLLARDVELRRRVFDAFQLAVKIDRNKPHIRLKALISNAFAGNNLNDLVANGSIAGAGLKHLPATCFASKKIGTCELNVRTLGGNWHLSGPRIRSKAHTIGAEASSSSVRNCSVVACETV